jgi:hypothetical protein
MPSSNKQLQNVRGKKGTSDLRIISLPLYHLSHSNHVQMEKLLNNLTGCDKYVQVSQSLEFKIWAKSVPSLLQ